MKTSILPIILLSCACFGFSAPGQATAGAPAAIQSITVLFNGTKATYADDLGRFRVQLSKSDLTTGAFRYTRFSQNVGKLAFEDWDEYSGTFTLTFDSKSRGTFYKSYTGPYTGYISGNFTILEMDVPQPPVAVGKTVNVQAGSTARFKLQGRGFDVRKTGLEFLIIQNPKSGRLDASKLPAVAYTPKRGFKGIDPFKFIVKEGSSKSKPATVKLVVR